MLSHAWLFVTLWTVSHQAPLAMGFSRQEYWSWLPWPPTGDLPNPGIRPTSLMSSALADGFFTTSATWEAPNIHLVLIKIPVAQMVKNLPACGIPEFHPWGGKIWRREWQPTLVFLPGESPCTEEPGGLQSMGSHRSDTTDNTHNYHKACWKKSLLKIVEVAPLSGHNCSANYL